VLTSARGSSTEERAWPIPLESTDEAPAKTSRPTLARVLEVVVRWCGWVARSWSWPVRVLVTLGLLGVVVVRSDLPTLLQDLSRANLVVLLSMLVCSYLVWVVNTFRWQRILTGLQVQCDFHELYQLNLASLFYSLALPGQISGEVVKAFRLSSRLKQHRVVYVSILLDRVFGMTGLILLGGFALALSPPPSGWVGLGLSWAMLAGVTAAAGLVLAVPWLVRLPWPVLLRHHPVLRRLGTAVCRATSPASATPSVSMLLVGCVLSVVAQALTAAIAWGVALALGVVVSPLALTWVLTLGTIIGMFPISVAGLGVREATYVGLLSLFGVSAGSALALSLAMFAILIALGLTGAALDVLVGTKFTAKAYPPDRAEEAG
jgi:uncharacterized membrane protein YbhN (UPF0104 family)